MNKPGPIQLSPTRKYLQYADGTPFFWLADTWWYGGTGRTTLSDFETLVKKRKQQGFTVIQMVVGIPPEADPFSENCKNTGGFPFNQDWSINTHYFDEIDKKILLLIENGLVPCIVGGWGNQITSVGLSPLKKLWDEILTRYSKYSVIFCLCGEANLTMTYLPGIRTEKNKRRLFTFLKRFKLFALAQKIKRRLAYLYVEKRTTYIANKNITLWNELAKYIQQRNRKNHPLTVHVRSNTTAKKLFHNPAWLSINSLQSGHDKNTVPFMVQTIYEAAQEALPIINMEPWYEGIHNNFDAYYQRFAFWACVLSGAKGHSYGAHGIWQMAKNHDNFLSHWGNSDWKESLSFKGAEQLGRAVQFLYQYSWWQMQPDFTSVSPFWKKDHPLLPLAATIDKKDFFVYIPDVHLIKSELTLTAKGSFIARGFLPETMQHIPIKQISNKILLPKETSKDFFLTFARDCLAL